MATKTSSGISKERHAEIQREVHQRVALEKKAFELVMRLSLADSVTEKELIDIGQQITRDNYSDVTEERSIEKICGYPLCSNKLEKILKQKYKISVKNATVYDLTERKKFCSNQCYEASKYFQNQLSETSVWTRETEEPVTLTILRRDETQKVFPKGRNGEVVLECPWGKVSEELEALKLDDADKTDDNSIPTQHQHASEKNLNTAREKRHLLNENEKMETPLEEQQQKTACLDFRKASTSNSVQQHQLLLEKLKVIKEWKTTRTTDFFHPTVRRELPDYESKGLQFCGSNQERNDKTDVRLAAVDQYSQQTQRRKIVLQRLSTVWPKLTMLLDMDVEGCIIGLRDLVSTFEFSNKNILFQTHEWLIVGYILLRILDEHKKCLSNEKPVRLDLTPYSITEEEVTELVDYMMSYTDLDMVD